MTARSGTKAMGARCSRRHVLGLGAAVAAGSAFGWIHPALSQSSTHVLKLGDATVTVISDGTMSLPVSFLLGQVDAKTRDVLLTSRALPNDAFTAQVNIVVVKTPTALLVIDSGGTPDFMPTLGKFPDSLERAGIAAADVTHVILTHAHADHFWGLIDPLDDDTRFSNAKHYMTAVERDFWLKPGIEDKVPDAMKGVTIGTARRMKMIAKRIDAVKPGTEVITGVSMVDTAGHSAGHASILLSFGGQSLLVGGDALSHPIVSFEKPDWILGADLDAERALATRKRLLDQLATDKTALLGYHLPWPGIGRVERSGNGYRYLAG